MDDVAGQVIPLGPGLGSSRVGLPDMKWEQLSHAYNFRAGFPTPAVAGLALLCCSGEMQGLLS